MREQLTYLIELQQIDTSLRHLLLTSEENPKKIKQVDQETEQVQETFQVFIREMEDLKNITVAIIPIGEGKTAMNPQSAAEATNLIKPGIVIPVHYNLGQN
ncbi:MAG: hypothetical protein MUQ20_01670, partial [Deltaproteobacteria bacterium]|nr:hypothetical protein [Deltaproteobacteria bacterium]